MTDLDFAHSIYPNKIVDQIHLMQHHKSQVDRHSKPDNFTKTGEVYDT